MTDQPTFEYRDEDGDDLIARPMRGIPAVLILTGTNGIAVDLDRVEEVVAGIRDAARTAARQTTGQDDTWPLATPCGYCAHTLNWHVTGGRCRVTAGENGCGCTTFVAPDGSHPDHPHHAPAVGQPAEAHDTEARPPRVQWRVEGYDADEWNPLGLPEDDHDTAVAKRAAWGRRLPGMPTRIVREDTTWIVEGEQPGTWVPQHGRPLTPEEQAFETRAAADTVEGER